MQVEPAITVLIRCIECSLEGARCLILGRQGYFRLGKMVNTTSREIRRAGYWWYLFIVLRDVRFSSISCPRTFANVPRRRTLVRLPRYVSKKMSLDTGTYRPRCDSMGTQSVLVDTHPLQGTSSCELHLIFFELHRRHATRVRLCFGPSASLFAISIAVVRREVPEQRTPGSLTGQSKSGVHAGKMKPKDC